MSFVPMNFCFANRTIYKLDSSDAFQFPPSAFSIIFPKPLALANCGAGCNRFHIYDSPNNLEVHEDAPLEQIRQSYEHPLVLPQLMHL
jgi:hypothetical protein